MGSDDISAAASPMGGAGELEAALPELAAEDDAEDDLEDYPEDEDEEEAD